MKKQIFAFALIVLALAACKPNREQMTENINLAMAEIDPCDITADDEKAQHIVTALVEYADAFPEDSTLAAQYLLKAAEFSSQMGNIDEAIDYLDRIISDYPDYENISLCYFLKGHFYELSERYDDAIAAYNAYLTLFPDDYLTESTRQMLPYVGRPSEELLEMVQKQALENLSEKQPTTAPTDLHEKGLPKKQKSK